MATGPDSPTADEDERERAEREGLVTSEGVNEDGRSGPEAGTGATSPPGRAAAGDEGALDAAPEPNEPA
jgi:hypothetical protein